MPSSARERLTAWVEAEKFMGLRAVVPRVAILALEAVAEDAEQLAAIEERGSNAASAAAAAAFRLSAHRIRSLIEEIRRAE